MRLLVIRTSAMGDVALTTPVMRAVRQQYPDLEMVFLTRPAFKPFFYSIDRLTLFFIDIKVRHRGIPGLIRLFRDLRGTGEFDYVIDLHDVLRSKVLRWLFWLTGVHSSIIDKGRKEKREVISGKRRTKLRHTVERYCDTFAKAGFPVVPADGPWIIPSAESLSKISSLTGSDGILNVGVAPFAMHKLKMWPEEYMFRLLKLISENRRVKFFLFGGKEESARLEAFKSRLAEGFNTAGNLSLDEELALMSRLDLMIAMDSSNMHMAALTGTRVVSVWGATDPLNGFSPWGQPEEHIISIPVEELTCRPCTVYGKGECRRGDLACMNWLAPDIVFKKIVKLRIL